MRRLLTIILVLFLCYSCDQKKSAVSKDYSFFVAGHLYGKPQGNSVNIHPPFKAVFPFLNAQDEMDFGVFTGDLVRKSTVENFQALNEDLSELVIPYYVVPGNHDIGNRKLYDSIFGYEENGNRSYVAFVHKNDLFIILDGNLKNESIVDEQLNFVKESISDMGEERRNIFVFVHQLIWWNKYNEFKNVTTNWPPYTPDTNNYWTDVEPLLRSTLKPVYFFAGDLGANHIAEPYMYYKKDNIHYVGSGMGQGVDDNFIIVKIDQKGDVQLELVALQGDKDRFGKLEDYNLP